MSISSAGIGCINGIGICHSHEIFIESGVETGAKVCALKIFALTNCGISPIDAVILLNRAGILRIQIIEIMGVAVKNIFIIRDTISVTVNGYSVLAYVKRDVDVFVCSFVSRPCV